MLGSPLPLTMSPHLGQWFTNTFYPQDFSSKGYHAEAESNKSREVQLLRWKPRAGGWGHLPALFFLPFGSLSNSPAIPEGLLRLPGLQDSQAGQT